MIRKINFCKSEKNYLYKCFILAVGWSIPLSVLMKVKTLHNHSYKQIRIYEYGSYFDILINSCGITFHSLSKVFVQLCCWDKNKTTEAAPFSCRCFQPGLLFHFPWAVSLQANRAFPALPSFLTCQICIPTRQFITGEACEHSRRLFNRNFYLISLCNITLIPDKWCHIFQKEGSHKKKRFPNLISASKPEVLSLVFTHHEYFPLILELDPF